MYRPDYEGSDDYEVPGLPILGVNYRDIVILRGPSLMLDVIEMTAGAEAAKFAKIIVDAKVSPEG